ncbi:hypothetical protein CK203_065170 [Vitis vinifera]|uniref:NB-ARC domain-containing protein n=1 Tax=Vitis vinifera TaxID=29760 RepID=A0A438G3Y7_VITVI|nr:hypothetical protein CK203_066511 [Vitis vinifera]RVW68006.1 hypothetical protein CK203_065170 [Vitis vinifera]
MSEDFLEFLRNKFIDGLAEAEDQGSQLPMHRRFQGIRGVLLRKDITSSTPIQMIQMRNTLYRLLAVYTDCLIFSEKHPIPSTKFLLPFYNLFHFWFLKSTKEVLVRIKGELGLYPCIEDSNGSPDHSEDQESQSHDPENQSQIWYPHVSEIRGETALARQLFYDEHIQGAFFPTLWISLSGKIDADIDLKQVVKDMLVELTTEHGHEKLRSCSTEELLSSLGRQLLGKKYLIVLDGIWDETRDWYFRLGQALNWPDKDCNIQFGRDQKRNGNAVIITTRLGSGKRDADKSKLNPQQNDKLKKLQNEIVEQCDGFPLGVKTLAEIIPGALAKDHCSVNAEPERGHIDSDHYSATQNHRGDGLTEIVPMEVQIDGGGLHCPTCKLCPKTLRHPLASKVAGRLGSKQSWAKKRREPNNIMAFIHWLASLRPEEKGAQFHFVEFERFTTANQTGKLVIRTEILTINGP